MKLDTVTKVIYCNQAYDHTTGSVRVMQQPFHQVYCVSSL